jgi:hypothetical protein
MELWSNYDEYYGHQRRYTLATLAELAGPYRLAESGHFFHALYLAGLVAKAVGGGKRSLDVASPRALAAHRAVGWLFDREEALLARRLPGSSLYGLFAK